MTKFIYIDESGDLGLKTSKTSTKHFVVAAVLVADESTKIELEAILIRFKKDVGIPTAHELKFHSLSDKNKVELLSKIKKLPLEFYGFVVQKEQFTRQRGIDRPIDLQQQMLTLLFTTLKEKLKTAIVTIDRSIDARLVALTRTAIRRAVGHNTSFKVVFARSKNQPGLQVADLVAGSILRRYERQDSKFFEIIKTKTKLYP